MYFYSFTLYRSSYAVTKGPFGGIKGRDYLAVLSLDGTLSIFEQETHTFSRFLPGFLVPGNHNVENIKGSVNYVSCAQSITLYVNVIVKMKNLEAPIENHSQDALE